MTEQSLTNDQVLAGEGTSKGAKAFRGLVEGYGLPALLKGYSLPEDAHWTAVLEQAFYWGDISSDGELQ